MIETREGRTLHRTFVSLSEYADYAEQFSAKVRALRMRSEWVYGEAGHTSNSDAFNMARMGWESKVDQAFELVDSVIEQVERDYEMPKQVPVWDVAGGAVDVGAYLSGVPECMMEFPMPPTMTSGRVVNIVVSLSASAAIDGEALIKRGIMIAGLAQMLERLGYNTEIWGDLSASGGARVLRERILIKSAYDMIDPARILYAVANPSMLRVIGFAAMHGLDYAMQRSLGVGSGYGCPTQPLQDLDEGTIYLPAMYSGHNYDVKAELVGHLKNLGIIE